jgi:branched-chain amino acid transport system permease protein
MSEHTSLRGIISARYAGRPRNRALGLGLLLGGAAASAGSTFLAWTWTPDFPGDLSVSGYPGGNQDITLVTAAATLLCGLGAAGIPGLRRLSPAGFARPARGLAFALAASTGYVLMAIVAELGGIANWVAGSYVAAAAVALTAVGAVLLPDDQRPLADWSGWAVARGDRGGPGRGAGGWRWPAEIAAVLAAVLAGLLLLDYGLTTSTGELFIGFALAIGLAAWGLAGAGIFARLGGLFGRRPATVSVSALVAAVAFIALQHGNDVNTTLADNVLIFATVALGLNIVVGLAGLLDLGYVAFLGCGAYAAALLSGSAFSRFADIHLPFGIIALAGVAVAMIMGVVIGAPTLRLRGDYLAIVTLGFGEIFRITMNNLDGQSGPSLTNGPNGIPAIPDLSVGGFSFARSHSFAGITIDRFGNYYLLLVLVIAVVVFIFGRVNNSQIGRAWVAIREDETAAAAMGINGFRLKLLAFALGAALAGLAGTIQAHVTGVVSPDQYQFTGTAPPNSAFLLAAVVLGGMGTITGPLLGAALLYVLPEKLQFFSNKELLLFGLALIVMMRFRPEGLVPSRRRALEFHEEQITEEEALQAAGQAAGQAAVQAAGQAGGAGVTT